VRTLSTVVITSLLICGCMDTSAPDPAAPSSSLEAPASAVESWSQLPVGLEFMNARQVFEPQMTYLRDGTLVLTWRESGETGSNLYSSVRTPDGAFGSPVRVNDATDTVASIALDGMRAAIAVTSDNTIAVAWSDTRAQIRAAISTNGGVSFEPSIRLDQAEEPAYRGFPSISFDQFGDLHAIWIDSRFAVDFAEEPADLYYAKVSNGAVIEKNLTAAQQPSICGCCRTFINAEEDSLKITFRNTTAEGYRDPYAITTSKDGEFSAPQAVTSPLWELTGCPMAGPIFAGDEVLWHDGSTGKKLAMVSSPGQDQANRVFDDEERGNWTGRQSPRAVSTKDGTGSVLLLPGRPASRLISRGESEWHAVADDLPPWSRSGAYENGQLLLVGATGGAFQFEQREVATRVRAYF
jgi:hypothetical protein